MAQYDFTLPANGAQTLDVSGTYFSYKGGLGPIRVTSSDGAVVDLLPGQGMSKLKFDRLTVKDISGVANVGIILAGNGEWRDERITGTVEVVDGGKNRTMANQAFMARTYLGATAGNTPEIQLWNPPASNKRLIVERVGRTCANGGSVGGFWSAVQGATLIPNAGISKLAGGAFSAAQLRTTSTVGGQTANYLFSDVLQPGIPVQFQFIEPVIVPPGWGLTLGNSVIAGDLVGTFEYFEEPI
jgi:hypothetical protein